MKALFDFALDLLSKGFLWLGAIVVCAIAAWILRPIRLSISIGDRRGRR
jgi:hypothetical protein